MFRCHRVGLTVGAAIAAFVAVSSPPALASAPTYLVDSGVGSGYLFQFDLTGNRRMIAVDDERLEDRVADNVAKHDVTESESLLVGRDFGVVPDIEPSAAGSLLVASLTRGAIYEITRR